MAIFLMSPCKAKSESSCDLGWWQITGWHRRPRLSWEKEQESRGYALLSSTARTSCIIDDPVGEVERGREVPRTSTTLPFSLCLGWCLHSWDLGVFLELEDFLFFRFSLLLPTKHIELAVTWESLYARGETARLLKTPWSRTTRREWQKVSTMLRMWEIHEYLMPMW